MTETERLEAKQSSASRTVPNSNGEKPMLEHFEDLLNLSIDCPCDDWSGHDLSKLKTNKR
jgi:hypothetical protein